MEEINTQENTPDINRWSGKKIFVLVVVALMLGVGALLLIEQEKVEVLVEVPVDPFAELKGKLYLTLAPAEGDRGGGERADTNEYFLDVRVGELTEVIPEDESVKISSGISPDGSVMAYMSSPYDPNSPEDYFYPATEISQLHTFNLQTGEQKRITNQGNIGKRQPKWSPDGEKVAFYSTEVEYFKRRSIPDAWFIHTTDLDGNIEFIARGVQPFWSPDGKYVLYVGNDGLYVYGKEDQKSKLVHDFGVPITTFMKFDLSDDGTMLAWSHPEGNNITLFEIESWGPFSMRSADLISISGFSATYWPVFSPDNRYVAFQWIDSDPNMKVFFDFQLMVYDRESGQKKTLLSLDPYRFDASFVSDWVY